MSSSRSNGADDQAGETAVLLAGGLGTRLRGVVGDRPKVLAEVGGRPFLAILLDRLIEAGFRRAVLCVSYRVDLVRAEFGGSYRSLALEYSEEAVPMGTGGALRLALPMLPGDAVLALNGDSFCDVDLRAFWDWCRSRRAPAGLVLARVVDVSRYGLVLVSGERIVSFKEKQVSSGPGWVNAGIYYLSRPVIEAIPSGQLVSLEREVLPGLVATGLYGYRNGGRFIDIGVPEAYAAAQRFPFAAQAGHHR